MKNELSLSEAQAIGMLEYWNDGIMGSGEMGQCFIGKIPFDNKVNKWEYFFQNQHSNIPPFHYSMCEAKIPGLKTSL